MSTALGAFLFGSVALSTVGAAQEPRRNWSFEASAGGGYHTEHAGDTWFERARSPLLRFAVARTLAGQSSSPYVMFELLPGLEGDRVAICRTAPNGSCRKPFPDNGGVGVALGIRHDALDRTTVGARVGGGGYGGSTRAFAELDATGWIVRRVGILVAARYMTWSQEGASIWYAPITLGLRIR